MAKKKKKVAASKTAQQPMYDKNGKAVGVKFRRNPNLISTKL
jgi:hypothetical protein